MQDTPSLHFGPYRVDPCDERLWCGTQAVRLTPKAWQVLWSLVTRAQQLVTKEDLLAAVWPETAVSDAALTTCIRELRRALRDDAKRPTYIETVHRRGFRFIAPVTPAAPAETPTAPTPPPDEATQIRQALTRTGGNVSQAARLLGLNRNTLRNRMRRYWIAQARVEEGAHPAISAPAPGVPSPGEALEDGASAPVSEVPRAPASTWEQKPVAVLAIDLTFPRPSAQTAPPSDARTVTARWERRITDKIHGFGGVCVQHSPSLCLAVFGLPRALERMPQRAVHAALAIQRLTTETRLPEEHEPAPVVRLAIHLGVVITDVQASDPGASSLPVGETLAVPVRLLGHARAGELLVSSQVGRQIEDMCELQSRALSPEAELASGVEVYRVTRVKPWHLRAARGLTYPLSPFVGRARELAGLHERLAQAASGQGQVVGIIGDPGMGKSRLLVEFRASLDAQPRTYLEGQCLSYGTTVPYLPVLDILRQHCRIVEMDTPETLTAKVHQTLREVELVPEEWAPYLVQLLGVQVDAERITVLSPEAIRRRTFTALRQVLLASSQQRPLIIALEDLQWIDQTSEDFFVALVESLAGAAVLVLTTYRPGYHPPWMERSYVTQMALPSLASHESAQLVSAMLQAEQVPESVMRDILAKAEGNPFFLEELVRAITADSNAQPHREVPDTIQGVLMARIDRLPDASRELLQLAAILGREVPLKLLQGLWEGPGEVETHLSTLQQLEFLYEHVGTSEPFYFFKHALTQDVAYGSVLPSRRQAVHAAVGLALEVLYAEHLDDAVDRLAYHYGHSAEAAKAVTYLTQLAAKAARSYAHVEAVAAYQEALGHVEQLPGAERDQQHLDLLLRQAFSLSILGRFREILDRLLPQLDVLERLQEPTLTGPYYFRLGLTLFFLGDYEQAVKHGRYALEAAQWCSDHATMGMAYYLLSLGSNSLGQFIQGVEYGQLAVGLLQGTEDRHWLGITHWNVGLCATSLGDFDLALEALPQARAIGDAIDDPRLQSLADGTTGLVHALRGEWEAGLKACQRGLERSPDPVNTAITSGLLGIVYLEKHEPTQAVPLLEQSMQLFRRFQSRAGLGRYAAVLGEALLADDQLEKARHLALEGLEISRETKYTYGIGLAQRALGRIAQASQDYAEALHYLHEAFQTFTALQARYAVARTHLLLAELAYAQGNREVLMTHLHEAHHLFTTLRVPKYAERTADLARRFEVALPSQEDAPIV